MSRALVHVCARLFAVEKRACPRLRFAGERAEPGSGLASGSSEAPPELLLSREERPGSEAGPPPPGEQRRAPGVEGRLPRASCPTLLSVIISCRTAQRERHYCTLKSVSRIIMGRKAAFTTHLPKH